MAYKIKDLMIHLPTKVGGPRPFNTCSGCAKSNIIQPISVFCLDGAYTQITWQLLTPVAFGARARSEEDSLTALATLKEQLTQQLSEVEREQDAVKKSMAPQTVEEVDMLTAKLNEALKELKVLRAALLKKPNAARSK